MSKNFEHDLSTTWTLGQNLDRCLVQVEVIEDERVKLKKGHLDNLDKER